MNPDAANQMLITSDYTFDKAIYLGTYTHNLSSGADISIPHNLGFTPLVKVTWSLNSSFTQPYGLGQGVYIANPDRPFDPILSFASATSSSINLSFGAIFSAPTVYLRLYAYMPSNVNTTAAFTASIADNFIINSDVNYSKLYLSDITPSSSTPSTTVTVNHDLGYRPQIEAWYEQNNTIFAMSGTVYYANSPQEPAVEVFSDRIVMTRGMFISAPQSFHYRIYLDRI
jgi:hypothetical protein